MDCQIIYFCKLIKSVIHSEEVVCLDAKVDWDYMVQLAREQNLLSVIIEAATKQPSFFETTDYNKYINQSISSVVAQVKRTNAFLELYEAFIKADLHPLVMKGLICRNLYENLADYRPSGDEDLLICLDEYWKARDILMVNGYITENGIENEVQLKQQQEVSFINPTTKLHIELHINVMGREDKVRSLMSDYFKDVYNDCREEIFQGVTIRTMSHQKHLTYLILHAFKHFIGGGVGVRQMIDILMYQEKHYLEIDFEQLQKVLHDFKAELFWNDILCIGNCYLGFDFPTYKETNRAEELLEDMIKCGVFGNSTQAQRTAMGTVIAATENHLQRKGGSMLSTVCKSLFPRKTYLIHRYEYLNKMPWLLPIAWLQRIGEFVKKNKEGKGGFVFESIKISRRRIKLLKKYDLV